MSRFFVMRERGNTAPQHTRRRICTFKQRSVQSFTIMRLTVEILSHVKDECIRLYRQRHLCKNDGSVQQFDKLQHCQEMASEFLNGHTEIVDEPRQGQPSVIQQLFDQYGARFNRGKWQHKWLLKLSDTSEIWLAILCCMEQSSKSSEFTSVYEKCMQDGS